MAGTVNRVGDGPVMTREEAIEAFLVRTGWERAERLPVAGDASFRSYLRLKGAAGRAVLMDAPPAAEDVRSFLAIANLLGAWGFSAPRVLDEDIAAGLVLLEDLGEETVSELLETRPDRQWPLFEAAVDALVALHDYSPPSQTPISPRWMAPWPLAVYDGAPLFDELHLFTDWYLPAVDPEGAPEAWRGELDPLWAPLVEGVAEDAETAGVLTLRDFHAGNLMWLPERTGPARVGLLDFQDARIGHPAYDLVSLLQDSRRDIPPDLETAMLQRYLDGRRARGQRMEDEAFLQAYRILGAQRAAKVIGIFTRLDRRDGKPGYLRHIPRVWSRLEQNLAAGGFTALDTALDRIVPRDRRKQPPPA